MIDRAGTSKVSIIIPNYNNQDIYNVVDSVINQDYPNFEIIIVDNSPLPEFWQKLNKLYQHNNKIKLVKPKENLGGAGGRNYGIKYCDPNSSYVLFSDHDIFLKKNALSELVKVSELDQEIGIVTSKVLVFSDPKVIWSAGTSINLVTGQIHFDNGEDVGQYEKNREIQVAPTAIILVKRTLLNILKSFDSIYFHNYEDTDFCFRAKKNGYKVMYAPKSIVYHKELSKADKLVGQTFHIARNRIIFMKRHSKYFGIFLLFLPVYFIYYSQLSLRNKRLDGIYSYIKGTYAGLSLVIQHKC